MERIIRPQGPVSLQEAPHPRAVSAITRIELTKKLKRRIVGTREITVSPDLKTLTMTMHILDQRLPNILIFDRE